MKLPQWVGSQVQGAALGLSGGAGVPVLCSRCGRLQLLHALLEKLFVLVDEVSLHLRHLGHDLLPAEASHLGLPLPLRLVFVSDGLQETGASIKQPEQLVGLSRTVAHLLQASPLVDGDAGAGRGPFSDRFDVFNHLHTNNTTKQTPDWQEAL